MELCSLYNRLGQLIRLRGTIEHDLKSAQSESGNRKKPQLKLIESLEDQHKRVQQQVIEIDREIRKCELARAGVKRY